MAAASFWAKVERRGPDECWPWVGARKPRGYGNVRIDGKYRLAHRVAWELATGTTIPSGCIVMHRCDNPPCCNPAHLLMGTMKDNTADMRRKGRDSFFDKRPADHFGKYAPRRAHG